MATDNAEKFAQQVLLVVIFILSYVGLGTGEYCTGYYNTFGAYRSGFSCPTWSDYSYERYCCGSSSNKYCCSTNYYTSSYSLGSTLGGAIVGGICFIVFIVVLVCCFVSSCPLYQKRHRGRVITTAGTSVHTTRTVIPPPTVAYTGTSGGAISVNTYPQGGAFVGAAPPPYAPAYPPPNYNQRQPMYPPPQQPPIRY